MPKMGLPLQLTTVEHYQARCCQNIHLNDMSPQHQVSTTKDTNCDQSVSNLCT
jgi:hypothetical protein